MEKLSINRNKFWGIALLTAFAGAPLVAATAAPNPNPSISKRSDRRNDKRRDDDRRNDKRRNDDRRDDKRRDDKRRDDKRRDDKRGKIDNRRDDKRRDDYRRNDGVRNDRYESARTYRGTVEVLLPGNEFNARVNGRIYKVYSTASTRDLRVGDSIDISGQMDRGVNIRNARVSVTRRNDNNGRDRYNRDGDRYDRDRYDRDRDYRDRYNRDSRNNRSNATFSGTVINVRSGNSFDLRADNRTYNVYTSASLPRGLSRNDEVRVYGRPYGDNDIRSASVSVTRDTRNDPRRDDRYGNDRDDRDNNASRSYSGVVTDVKNSREFDIRVDGRTYNVYATSSTRGLDRGDEVRVYGDPVGSNDIRNANVRITRNR